MFFLLFVFYIVCDIYFVRTHLRKCNQKNMCGFPGKKYRKRKPQKTKMKESFCASKPALHLMKLKFWWNCNNKATFGFSFDRLFYTKVADEIKFFDKISTSIIWFMSRVAHRISIFISVILELFSHPKNKKSKQFSFKRSSTRVTEDTFFKR